MTTFKEAVSSMEFNQNSEDFVIVCKTENENKVKAFCHGDTLAMIESLESLIIDLKKDAIRQLILNDSESVKEFLDTLKSIIDEQDSIKH
jgi:hypothetical protein